MAENIQKYDLILQNEASKNFSLFEELEDLSCNHLYAEFEMDMDLPEGEYTYVLIPHTSGATYDFKTPIQNTIRYVDDDKVVLKDLGLNIGLMRIGKTITPSSTYEEVYEGETTQKDNDIFYYEG